MSERVRASGRPKAVEPGHRETIRFTAIEWKRVAGYISRSKARTKSAWLRRRILQAGSVAFLRVRLGRTVRTFDAAMLDLPASTRERLAPLRDELVAMMREAGST